MGGDLSNGHLSNGHQVAEEQHRPLKHPVFDKLLSQGRQHVARIRCGNAQTFNPAGTVGAWSMPSSSEVYIESLKGHYKTGHRPGQTETQGNGLHLLLVKLWFSRHETDGLSLLPGVSWTSWRCMRRKAGEVPTGTSSSPGPRCSAQRSRCLESC